MKVTSAKVFFFDDAVIVAYRSKLLVLLPEWSDDNNMVFMHCASHSHSNPLERALRFTLGYIPSENSWKREEV